MFVRNHKEIYVHSELGVMNLTSRVEVDGPIEIKRSVQKYVRQNILQRSMW